MDEKLRLASLTAFYFGTRVATDPTSPEAITSVSKRAYRDLSRTLHGIGAHPAKTALLKDTHASLHKFVTDLETAPLPAQEVEVTQRDFDDRHDAWCLERMEAFSTPPHVHRGKTFTFTYGHAQKWINMACKYLAVLGHPTVAGFYPYLHIPIDSIVYTEAEHPSAGLAVPRPPRGRAWSRLNREQYQEYQQRLRAAIATHSDGNLTPLDWEAQAWVARSSSTSGEGADLG